MATFIIMAVGCSEKYAIDSLGIEVTAEENREYSYTDKQSGFWYGNTHGGDLQWFSGWNIAKKRIFSDYQLVVDGKLLDRAEAECTVYPDRLERRWDNAEETFRLIDNRPIIHIALKTQSGNSLIDLDRSLISDFYTDGGARFYVPVEDPQKRVMVESDLDGGFVITYGTEEECRALYIEFMEHGQKFIQERRDRINSLVTVNNPVKSNLPELDKALDWITITMDELITCQQGNGIYAGLP